MAGSFFTLKIIVLLFMFTTYTSSCNTKSEQYLLVGTYTNSGSKGIYVYKMNMDTGDLMRVSDVETENPSYLTVRENFVYAVNETAGKNGGGVSSFKFDKKTGKLTFLQQFPTGGDAPCYLDVSNNAKWLTTANYTGGSLAVFPLENGELKPYIQLIQHEGRGVDPERQEKPHVHTTVFSPDHKYLIASDLGLDKLFIYKILDNKHEPLTPAADPFVKTGPASGPRHITFSSDGKRVYLVTELNGMVIAYNYDDGKLIEIQRIELSDKGQTKNVDGAAIKLSPDGKFLYASSRGKVNTITIYSVDKETGKLQRIGTQDVGGDHPRDFTIDKGGKYLIVANKNSNNIVIFQRDKSSGLLTKSGVEVNLPQPVCVKLVDLE